MAENLGIPAHLRVKRAFQQLGGVAAEELVRFQKLYGAALRFFGCVGSALQKGRLPTLQEMRDSLEDPSFKDVETSTQQSDATTTLSSPEQTGPAALPPARTAEAGNNIVKFARKSVEAEAEPAYANNGRMATDANLALVAALEQQSAGLALPPAFVSNDNKRVSAAVAGLLPAAGRGGNGSDNRQAGAGQPQDDLYQRLQDIAAAAREYGGDGAIAVARMQDVLAKVQNTQSLKTVVALIEEINSPELQQAFLTATMLNQTRQASNG